MEFLKINPGQVLDPGSSVSGVRRGGQTSNKRFPMQSVRNLIMDFFWTYTGIQVSPVRAHLHSN